MATGDRGTSRILAAGSALSAAVVLGGPACADQTLDLLAPGSGGNALASGAGWGGAPWSTGGVAGTVSLPDGGQAGRAWDGGLDAGPDGEPWEPGMPCFGWEACDPDEYCDLSTRECEKTCWSNDDCYGDRYVCAEVPGSIGHCVECTEDEHCTRGSYERPHCAVFSGLCVECVVDEHCTAPEPFCHPYDYRCRECVVSEQCDPDEYCDSDRKECVRRD